MSKDRYHTLLEAIEYERKEEEKYYQMLSQSKTEKELIESGILLTHLEIVKKYYTVGENVEIKFQRTTDPQRNNRFRVGAGCHLIINDETKRYRGTVSYIKRKNVGVIFQDDIIMKEHLNESHLYKLELIYDERPYIIMKNAIEDVIKSKEPHIVEIRDGISKGSDFSGFINTDCSYPIPKHLNENQVEAVKNLVHTERLGIIHGPPGTGKTSTIVGLVQSLLSHEKTILACAPSNNAVDLIAQKLDSQGIKVLRIGNVTRINDNIAHLSLDEKMSNHPDWQNIKKVKIQANDARKKAGTYKRKFGYNERQERNENYRESRELRRWARDLEDKLMDEIIRDAEVIVSTLIGLSTKTLEGIKFKTVIIDEASQTLEPECWNAMLRAERTILVGDHLQLPATVKSDKALELEFDKTLLDILSPTVKYSYLLKEQYRMNDKILSFSNIEFYENQLFSSSSVIHNYLTTPNEAVVFIDTSGCGFEEEMGEKSRSRKNEGEYFILREHFLQHKSTYENHSIGIISPYSAQVKYITEQVEDEDIWRGFDITINSIDGFQGQEKDIIYLSLVRNNDIGEIGFLKDYRRLNVALTRAKQKVVVIGNVATLSSDPLYLRLVDHIEKIGTYQSAWEYMGY